MLYKLINYQLNDQKIVIILYKLRDSAHFSTITKTKNDDEDDDKDYN